MSLTNETFIDVILKQDETISLYREMLIKALTELSQYKSIEEEEDKLKHIK